MKPITEQRRQDLIEFINLRMPLAKDDSNMRQVYEIALSSLNAVLVGKVNRGEVSDDNEYPHAKVECVHPHADWNNFKNGFALYTAPPVPVMKLPEKKDSEHVYHGAIGAFNAGKSAGYNECIADIEQLNGVGSDE